jgi:hypothetical protein
LPDFANDQSPTPQPALHVKRGYGEMEELQNQGRLEMIRSTLSIILGIVAGMATIIGGHFLCAMLYPPPSGVDMMQPEGVSAYIATMPVAAFCVVLAVYFVASVVGGATAALVAGRAPLAHAGFVGLLLTIAGAINVVRITHPMWFAVTSLAIYLPAALLAAWVVRGRRV